MPQPGEAGYKRNDDFLTTINEAVLSKNADHRDSPQFLQLETALRNLSDAMNEMSARQVIEHNGKKGVFTENAEIMDESKIFESAFMRQLIHAPNLDKRTLLGYIGELCASSPDFQALFYFSGEELEAIIEAFRTYDFSELSEEAEITIQAIQHQMQRLQFPYHIITDDDVLQPHNPRDVAWNSAIADLLAEVSRLRGSIGVLKNDFKVLKGSSISDRNTAMSIVGDLIYQPDLLARSSDMRMRLRGGAQVNGCFMEWAEGKDISHKPGLSSRSGISSRKKRLMPRGSGQSISIQRSGRE